MAVLTAKIEGVEALQARLARVMKVARDTAFDRTIKKVAAAMSEAQLHVPVITGRLRSSAFIRKTAVNQYRQDLAFGYEAPYASFVHERPEGRGYRWLARAFNKVLRGSGVAEMKREIASVVRAAWGR